MMSFRNSTTFVAAVALAVAIGMLALTRQTPNGSGLTTLAAADLNRAAVKAPPEYWFPRASTYADEVAKSNHEGF